MKLRRTFIHALVVSVASLGLAGCDNSSKQERYVAELRSSNEVPANTSTAVGRVVLLVAADASYAEYSAEVAGLSAGIQGGHFHRGAAGVLGPIVLSFFSVNGVKTNGVTPGTTDLEINKAIARTITKTELDAILTDLRAGNLYANVHTPNFPGGEIRGQMTLQN